MSRAAIRDEQPQGSPDVSNNYWRARIAKKADRASLPYDLPMRSRSFHYAKVERKVDARLDAPLRQMARKANVRIGDLWCAGLLAVLNGYGQSQGKAVRVGRAALGGPKRPRCSDPIADLVLGFVASTAVVEVHFTRDLTFNQLVAKIAANPSAPASQNVMEEMSGIDLTKLRPAMPVVIGDYPASRISAAGCDLAFNLDPRKGLTLHYNTFRFSRTGAHRMIGHMFEILTQVVGNADAPLFGRTFLTPNERESLESWNQTSTKDYPGDRCIHQLFEAQAEARISTTAIVDGNEDISFAGLKKLADRVSANLLRNEVKRGDNVAICAQRSIPLVAAYLGCWKVGAVGIPVDASLPIERLAASLEDSKPAAVIHDDTAPIASQSSLKTIHLDELGEVPETLSADLSRLGNGRPDDLAFVTYTSGAKKDPLGVFGSHRMLVNRLAWIWREWPVRRGEVMGSTAEIASVSFLMEIFGALLQGAPVVLLELASSEEKQDLLGAVATSRISRLMTSASALRHAFSKKEPQAVPDLKLWLVHGQRIDVPTVRRVHKHLPGAELVQTYGCTESTGMATAFSTSELQPKAICVPSGKPIANTQVSVLDVNENPVPIGIAGEIWIGGDSLAKGYLNSSEATGQHFLARDSQRWLRTGDIGKWLPDGNLEILGRAEDVINRSGLKATRYELEDLLGSHPDVEQAIVLRDPKHELRLVGFVTAITSKRTPRERELQAFMREQLSELFVPEEIRVLETIPRSMTGRVHWGNLTGEVKESVQVVEEAPPAPRLPSSELEQELAAIWGELLGGTPASTSASFFELGGQIDAVVALAALLSKNRHHIGLQKLVDHPTIAEQAQLLQDGVGLDSECSALYRHCSKGNRTPLFLVHDTGAGCIDAYEKLAERLSPSRPVYSLVSRGLSGFGEIDDVPALAKHYVDNLREVHPRGRCFVGGLRFGGRIAMEMARQMRATSQDVPLVVMLDTHPHVESLRSKIKRGLLSHDDAKALSHATTMVLQLPNVAECLEELAQRQVTMADQFFDRPFDGKVGLIKAKQRAMFRAVSSDYGWSRLATSGVEVKTIPARRELESDIDLLANALSELLLSAEPEE